jgi:hypothetical protein
MCFLDILFLLITISAQAQELTGLQLLDNAIEVHDLHGNWPAFKGSLQVTKSTPKNPDHVSDILIDKIENVFELNYKLGSNLYGFKVKDDACETFINNKNNNSTYCLKADLWRD